MCNLAAHGKDQHQILLFSAFLLLCGLFWLRSSFRTGTPERVFVNQCKACLKQIQGAKTMWATATNDTPTWADLVGPDRYLVGQLHCSRAGNYNIGPVGQTSNCSITAHNL